MPTSTFSIAAQTYPVGVTTSAHALPGSQTYSHASVTVDFSPWTSTATTLVEVVIEFSLDNQVTWHPLAAFTQVSPPPYATKGGTTSSVTVSYDTSAALDPTDARARVTVQGAACPLGIISLSAS